MGDYNPNAPHIVGMEWVPIRQADFRPDEILERGYAFEIEHAAPLVSGAFYVAEEPPNILTNVIEMVHVYPKDTAHLTGPIKIVTIPVDSVTLTGFGGIISGDADSLRLASDGPAINITSGAPAIGLHFPIQNYVQTLGGKRIVGARLIYTAGVTDTADLSNVAFHISYSDDILSNRITYQPFVEAPVDSSGQGGITALTQNPEFHYIDFSDVNPFANLVGEVASSSVVTPWRFEELRRLSTVEPASSRLEVVIEAVLPVSGPVAIGYAALEVFYCEETRVRYGGRRTIPFASASVASSFGRDGNMVRLFNTSLGTGTSLPPGKYLVTHVHRELAPSFVARGAPALRAVRQLYALPDHPGVQLRHTREVGDQFSRSETDDITHLTLHTASAIVTGVHAYGTQIQAPVYGSILATAEISMQPAPAINASFPQVRFYARRFGETSVDLHLEDRAAGISFVDISPGEFDALPEIADGWREVTLRFSDFPGSVVPSFVQGAGERGWEWSASGELPGNQWQVLAANGPSIPPLGGGQSTGNATYWAPFGATNTLTWQSPNVSGTAVDVLSDATLIFSQDPHPVSGFAIEMLSQVVTGVGQDCGLPPGCIPTGIDYINLTWNAQAFLPVTGFGAYELERWDERTGLWQQIMNATSPAVTGFGDFEARIGVQSRYRIRTCNVLDFCGPWVSGAAAIPAPGVTVGDDGDGILVFTSNLDPGASLAYAMRWDGEPVEVFLFPEASEVELQRMFGRDFFVAFHPLERGGEQFTRVLVVNAAAIAPSVLANLRSLRGLAWADVDYVCVRDELGNRWFANVRVPDGQVLRNRTIYLAQIQVTETTDTPSPVDPA